MIYLACLVLLICKLYLSEPICINNNIEKNHTTNLSHLNLQTLMPVMQNLAITGEVALIGLKGISAHA